MDQCNTQFHLNTLIYLLIWKLSAVKIRLRLVKGDKKKQILMLFFQITSRFPMMLERRDAIKLHSASV